MRIENAECFCGLTFATISKSVGLKGQTAHTIHVVAYLLCDRPVQRSVTASVGRQFLLPAAAAMAGTLHTEHLHPERDRSAAFHATFLIL